PHDPGRAAPAPDERCRRPRHRPDRADRPGRPARPRPCRQASATLCVAEDSDRRASRPSSGVVLSVSEPIPPTGGWCTSCPCRTASTCGCTCATTHRDSMIFQAKISTTISHYFAEPRAAFQLPQAISKACHGPHLPHRQKSPLKNGKWASSTGLAIAERRAIHFPDLADKPDLPDRFKDMLGEAGGMTVLYAPMLWEDRGVGSIVVSRKPAKPFSDKEIVLLQSFADQAAIAIQNARLFEALQAKTRDLEESLAQQTAT